MARTSVSPPRTGTPLAYQIEEWDAAKGTASIWVRIPTIKGNSRQEIRLHWGKADAASESNGAAVFNESNGYLSVWHMNDPVKDEVGSLESKDVGTTATAGVVGQARHLAGEQGIFGGDDIASYPIGRQFAQLGNLVPAGEAEWPSRRVGQRTCAGESGDALSQPATRENGMLLFRR